MERSGQGEGVLPHKNALVDKLMSEKEDVERFVPMAATWP
jgi:hypothetical protein